MYKLVLLMFSFLFFTLSSCYYDVEEDLYPASACNTDAVKYNNDILPILSRSCFSCHSTSANLGNVTLEGYDKLKFYVNSGALSGSINHRSGFSQMPQNTSKLAACDIAKIDKWIADGSPEN
ncbi:MAG: hypothetical protein IPM42_05310 [Saprospiraceae bacterium]|nr:hypothetical protein [Saprospiraceae bacterium]